MSNILPFPPRQAAAAPADEIRPGDLGAGLMTLGYALQRLKAGRLDARSRAHLRDALQALEQVGVDEEDGA